MKRLFFILIILLDGLFARGQEKKPDTAEIREDLEEMLTGLSQDYVYFPDKKVDLACLREYYGSQIAGIKTEEETVLFFEYLLDEFYDSHLILNSNRSSSFRLSSPFYVIFRNGKAIIANVWQTQIENLEQDVIGAVIEKINGVDFKKAIEEFPTHCNDKQSPKVREWIANKLLAGRYNQARILTLELANHTTVDLDLDKIKFKASDKLLVSEKRNGVGIIRINNSLGNNNLVSEFDKSLDRLLSSRALIIDLRNTVDGGNSYVARGIMSRFISENKPYQKHSVKEEYDNNPPVERSWIEYVSPRGKPYKNPVIILVDRWTGSMGEGLAIGFEGMRRATIVGTEMERLAGEMEGFPFKHQNFGYRISTAKVFHVNGTAREAYVPANYVKQTTTRRDEILEKALQLVKK